MAEYIDAELLMQKLSRMIDYCEKNKDKKFNALNVLFQVGDAIMDCPTADVAQKSEVAREIFEEIENRAYGFGACFVEMTRTTFDEIKKKYTGGRMI